MTDEIEHYACPNCGRLGLVDVQAFMDISRYLAELKTENERLRAGDDEAVEEYEAVCALNADFRARIDELEARVNYKDEGWKRAQESAEEGWRRLTELEAKNERLRKENEHLYRMLEAPRR